MDTKQDTNKQAFTLIELLLVMALLSILIVLLTGNFSTTLKRGRDQQRKNDLSQVQKALELYYEDNRTYPTFDIFTGPNRKFCTTQTCMTPNETVYMVKTPIDPSSSYVYRYEFGPGGAYYYLYSYIENDLDQGSGVNKNGYTNNEKCDAAKTTINCRYYVDSSNADSLILIP